MDLDWKGETDRLFGKPSIIGKNSELAFFPFLWATPKLTLSKVNTFFSEGSRYRAANEPKGYIVLFITDNNVIVEWVE